MVKLHHFTLYKLQKAAANKGFAIAGVPCFADTFVQGGSSVLRMKFSAKTPAIANPRNVSGNGRATVSSTRQTDL